MSSLTSSTSRLTGDPGDVKQYKCGSCQYSTWKKFNLNRHVKETSHTQHRHLVIDNSNIPNNCMSDVEGEESDSDSDTPDIFEISSQGSSASGSWNNTTHAEELERNSEELEGNSAFQVQVILN